MRSDASTWTRYLVPLGRVAFAGVFVAFAPANFTQQGIAWGASQGVPLARVLVPLAGVISLLGGLSVILRYRATMSILQFSQRAKRKRTGYSPPFPEAARSRCPSLIRCGGTITAVSRISSACSGW